jgi:hypothetical protein
MGIIQCGFNYFTPHEHDYTRQDHHTITISGFVIQLRTATSASHRPALR